ncbi:MAG: hybrid sensor histidine kinase/response regulator [Deltaproteobacteria bacterium]|nr:hybrid sensor histidine kinase/response regulator [Deltaproteobacteria bacterium]
MAKYDILLIGDGTNLLETMGWVLDYKGFAVKVTASPEAALEAMVKKNYDLVMGKLTMADKESLDILQRARRLNPEVKIMVVGGNHDALFPPEAYELEVDDYLLMPMSPPELWRRVSHCLENREVLDLQPVRGSAASSRTAAAGPQMMLMTHDVRGSMVATAASLKLMARGTYGELSEPARAKLHEAAGRIENTIQLLEDSLGRSLADRASAADGDFLNLAEDVVEPVLAELAAEIQDHRITLVNRLHNHGKGKVPVKGGKLWLKGVFRNLINNGIKYGGRGCTIVVDLETQGSASRLNVYNTGPTVPEDCRAMLFSYGRSLPQSKKCSRGLGVGLSLSRDVIRNYGGDIWYEPKKGGANFVMSLPPR